MPTPYAYDSRREQARQRLGSPGVMADSGTTHLLGSLGVGPGWRRLEVGGGDGSVAAWLSERVRPDGYVLATDFDPRFLVNWVGECRQLCRFADAGHDDLAPRADSRRQQSPASVSCGDLEGIGPAPVVHS